MGPGCLGAVAWRSVLACLLAAQAATVGASARAGDVNGNGVLDSRDLGEIVAAALAREGAAGTDTADCSGDIRVSVVDAACLLHAMRATTTVSGRFVPPAPLRPEAFEIVWAGGMTVPAGDGRFQAPVLLQGLSLLMARPAGGAAGEGDWLALVARPDPDAPSGEIVLDETSTAVALALLHPMFLAPDPAALAALARIARDLPEVRALASLVRQVYPETARPFDDPGFVAAVETACLALAALATTEGVAQGSGGGAQAPKALVLREDDPWIQDNPLDWVRWLDVKSPGDAPARAGFHFEDCTLLPLALGSTDRPDVLEVANQCGVGLDALVKLWRVDLSAEHRKGDAPFRLESLEDVLDVANSADAFPTFRTDPSYPAQAAFADANSLANYLMFIDQAIDMAGQVAVAVASQQPSHRTFTIDPGEDAVYVLRAFNGRLVRGVLDAPGEGTFAWGGSPLEEPSFADEQAAALVMNVFGMALDALAAVGAVDESLGPSCGTKVGLKGNQFLAGVDLAALASESPEDIAAVVLELGRIVMGELASCAVDAATGFIHEVGGLFRRLASLLNVLGRFGNAGRLAARLGGLTGWGPVAMFLSPMDTHLVVVGDPFSPRVDGVASQRGSRTTAPGQPPLAVDSGGELIVDGARFDGLGGDGMTTLTWTDELGVSAVAEIDAIEDLGTSSGAQRVTTSIPRELAGTVELEVEAPDGSAWASDEPLLEVVPVVSEPLAALVFAQDPHPEHRRLVLRGGGFVPDRHRIVVDATRVQVEEDSTNLALVWQVPGTVPEGTHAVALLWKDGAAPIDAGEVRALGPPSIVAVAGPPLPGLAFSLTATNVGEHVEDVIIRFTNTATGQQRLAAPVALYPDPPAGDGAPVWRVVVVLPASIFPTDQDSSGTAELVTPAGESAPMSLTVDVVAPASFTRTLFVGVRPSPEVPGLTLEAALAFANQRPDEGVDTGEMTQVQACDETCYYDHDGDPRTPMVALEATHCHRLYPPEWIPIPDGEHGHRGTAGVSPPRGTPAPTVPWEACSACDVAECRASEPPPEILAWTGRHASQIRDTMILGSGDEVTLGTAGGPSVLFGPRVTVTGSRADKVRSCPPGTPRCDGLLITGDPGGQPGAPVPQDIFVSLQVGAASGRPLIVRGARGVRLQVGLTESAPGECDIGVLIEDSQDVQVQAVVKGCDQAVVVRRSSDVDVQAFASGYVTAGVSIEASTRCKVSGDLGVRADGPLLTSPFHVPPGQRVGLRIVDGSSHVTTELRTVVGHENVGILLRDAHECGIQVDQLGVRVPSDGWLPATVDSEGRSTGNAVGIRVTGTSSGNEVRGWSDEAGWKHQQCACANDVAVWIEGGTDNLVTNLHVGVPFVRQGWSGWPAQSVTVPSAGLGNRIGILLQPGVDDQGSPMRVRDNIISTCVLGGNREHGIRMQGLSDANLVTLNTVGAALPAFGYETAQGPFTRTFTHDNAADGVSGIDIRSAAGPIELLLNVLQRPGVGILAEDSSRFSCERNTVESPSAEGLLARRSHGFSVRRDVVRGGAAAGGAASGLHLVSCGTFTLEDVRVEGMGGSGVEIEQPPAGPRGFAFVRGSGRSIAVDAPRQDPWGVLARPPAGRISATSGVHVRDNAAAGVFVHDGATRLLFDGVVAVGNGGDGVSLLAPGADVALRQSRIGVDETGVVSGNAGTGVRVAGAVAGRVRIGEAGLGNVVAASGDAGIAIAGSRDVAVHANFVGTSPSGAAAIGNDRDGVRVESSTVVGVGGWGLGEANLVSGNGMDGIAIDASDSPPGAIDVIGNFVGTDRAAGAALANGRVGIHASGARPAAAGPVALRVGANLVSGNALDGIAVESLDAARIDANLVGGSPGPQGIVRPLPNGRDGLQLMDAFAPLVESNRIGPNGRSGMRLGAGTEDAWIARNVIVSNADRGVVVSGVATRHDTLSRNLISRNAGRGIALELDGNASIARPVLRTAEPAGSGTWSFSGEVEPTVPDGSRVEIFADDDDEGRWHLADAWVLHGEFWASNVAPPEGVDPAGKSFHATVTDPDGNTSEFGPLLPHLVLPQAIATERQGRIALTRVATGRTEVVVEDGRDPSACEADGVTWIAFVRDVAGQPDVWLWDGTAATNLTEHPGADAEPSFSPDCTQIAFVSDRTGALDVHVMSRSGAGLGRLTDDEALDAHPDWSPDGSRVVFASNRSGRMQVHSVALAQPGVVTQLTSGEGSARRPAWRRLPGRLAFESCPDPQGPDTCVVATLDTATGEVRTVPSGDAPWSQPEWLVDGDGVPWLLVVETAPGAESHVLLVSEAGTERSDVTPSGLDDTQPSCCVGW